MKILFDTNYNTMNKDADFKSTDNIKIDVFDNEYYVLPLLIESDDDITLDVKYDIDKLVSNLDKNNLPHDVKIVTLLNKVSDDDIISIANGEKYNLYIGIDASYLSANSNIKLDINGNILNISVTKKGHMIHNKGADRINSLSRLEWLNSRLFCNKKSTYIYNDIDIKDDKIDFIGKTVTLSQDGFIKSVVSNIDETLKLNQDTSYDLLDGGIKLDISDNVKYSNYTYKKSGASLDITSEGEGDTVKVYNNAHVNYEGVFEYQVKVVAKQDTVVEIDEINAFSKYASKYMNGLGNMGSEFKPFNYKWNESNLNSIFIGNVNVGAMIKWLPNDNNYRYSDKVKKVVRYEVPPTWNNNGDGGIDILFEKQRAKVVAYTGKVSLKAGEMVTYAFEVYLTPFHPLDMNKLFKERFYQNTKVKKMTAKKIAKNASKYDLNNIILSKNQNIYSYINYPFFEIENIKELVESADEHSKVGIFYNLLDISTRCVEYSALSSMKDILIKDSNARNKTSENNVITQKINYNNGMSKNKQDVGVLVAPNSRYNNYYVECVNWLIKECGIKDIHMDTNVMDRDTIVRVRKALDRYKASIDMKVNIKNLKTDKSSSMNNVTHLLPFVDNIIVGPEAYKNMTPDALLTSVSGLPYGVPSAMIDGDPFLGMLFGMTTRSGYNQKMTHRVHKLMDKFEIEKSEMHGFWCSDALIAKDNGVKITYYKKDKKVLICMFNFNNYPAVFTVDYSPLKIKGIMKSHPISKLIMYQKFNEKTPVVLYNKCGIIIEADID